MSKEKPAKINFSDRVVTFLVPAILVAIAIYSFYSGGNLFE